MNEQRTSAESASVALASSQTLCHIPRSDDGVKGQAEAIEFLRRVLADGPRPAKEIEKEAETLDSEAFTLKRARWVLNVQSTKEGFGKEAIVQDAALPSKQFPLMPIDLRI